MNKIVIAIIACAAAGAAHAQTFVTSFESPTYTAGQSANGVYGWGATSFYGSTQTVSTARASDGTQSLAFDNTGTDLSRNGLGNGLSLGSSGLLIASVNVWLDGSTGAGRVAEVRTASTSNITNGFNGAWGLSIGGDGAVRSGLSDQGNLGAVIGFANVGSYLNRWLTFSFTQNLHTGGVSYRVSGFGAGQGDIVGTYAGSVMTQAYLGVYSNFNSAATNQKGLIYFDNIQVNAVPEPGSFAMLGLGALALLRRRR